MLSRLHEKVLRAVVQAGPECRAGEVREIVGGFVGGEVSFGSIFTTLDRLGEKGMVSYRTGEPDTIRGGRAPRLYTVTETGVAALDEVTRLVDAMRASARTVGAGEGATTG